MSLKFRDYFVQFINSEFDKNWHNTHATNFLDAARLAVIDDYIDSASIKNGDEITCFVKEKLSGEIKSIVVTINTKIITEYITVAKLIDN